MNNILESDHGLKDYFNYHITILTMFIKQTVSLSTQHSFIKYTLGRRSKDSQVFVYQKLDLQFSYF